MTDEVLHGLARVLLRVCSPARAHRALAFAATFTRPHADRAEMKRAAARLGRRGTCLSRAMAVAVRAPEAELVIGVTPGDASDASDARGRRPLAAHAWVELGGVPLDSSDVVGAEIARLRGRPHVV